MGAFAWWVGGLTAPARVKGFAGYRVAAGGLAAVRATRWLRRAPVSKPPQRRHSGRYVGGLAALRVDFGPPSGSNPTPTRRHPLDHRWSSLSRPPQRRHPPATGQFGRG